MATNTTIEQQFAALSAWQRPEDENDSDGQRRTLEERLSIAKGRKDAAEPPKTPPVTTPGANGPAANESGHLARLLDAERVTSNSLRSENERLNSELRSLNARNETLQSTIAGWSRDATISLLMSERDAALSTVKVKERDLHLLEGLCGVRGIDPSQAIPTDSEPPPPRSTVKAFQDRLAKASSSEERDEIMAEFSSAAKSGAILKSGGRSQL